MLIFVLLVKCSDATVTSDMSVMQFAVALYISMVKFFYSSSVYCHL